MYPSERKAVFEMEHEHLLARVEVGQRHVDLLVYAAGTQHSRVYLVGAVGGGDDKDALLGAVVELAQKLVDFARHARVVDVGAVGDQRVKLVEAQHRRCFFLCLLEETAYLLLRTVDVDARQV